MIRVYFDGACGPQNPGGRAGWGWVAYRESHVIEQKWGFVGEGPLMSCNVAEYSGILDALHWVKQFGDEPVEFLGDSKLVILQMQGRWKIKGGLYAKYARDAWRLRRSTHRYTWIPREENSVADALSVMGAGYIREEFEYAVDEMARQYRQRLEREA